MKPPDSANEAFGIQFDEPAPPPIPDHELIRCIGRGSYGEVWLAHNVMGTYRAVKVVYRRTFHDDRPFEREFAGLQRFEPVSRSHESQVDILHIGRSDDWFYYVMELADDEITGPEIDPANYRPKTLHAAHKGQIQYTADETLEIGLALTTALEHLHKHGLVHRDIKPSNVIFVNGLPKLADIGLVSSVDATRSFVGTEGFVPPEGPGAPTGDLYSMGKVLYELCTGRDRKDYPELPTAIAESPDRERLLELNAIIAKACRENPKDRYPSAAAMRQDLLLMQSGKSVRQMRKLEQRLRFVQRAGAAVTALAVLILAGWFYQARQTRIVSKLAAEKTKLATDNRERIVRLRVANGVREMNAGRLSNALLWFTEALPLVQNDPERARLHRIRIQAVLDQMPRLTQVLPHDSAVSRSWFGPNGRSLLTLSSDALEVWDTSTGRPLSSPLRLKGGIRCAGLSGDGKYVLTGTHNGPARVFDYADGWREVFVESNVTFCALAPLAESVLVCSSDRPSALIDLETRKTLHEFNERDGQPMVGVFSPDGRLLALANTNQQVSLWDVATGKRQSNCLRLDEPSRRVALYDLLRGPMQFDYTGSRLAIATQTVPESGAVQVEVWDATKGRRLFGPIKPRHGIFQGFALNADGSQLALITDQDEVASDHGDLELWDVGTGQLLRTLSPVSGSGVTFLPKTRAFAVMSWLNYAQLWDPATGSHVTPPLTHSAWVLDVAASPDEKLLATASDDGLVKLWRLGADPQLRLKTPSRAGHAEGMLCADANHDERLIATGGSDGVVRIWSTVSGDLLAKFADPQGNPVVGVQWSRDGRRILTLPGEFHDHVLLEPKALLWDTQSGQLVASFPVDAGAKCKGAMSLDGSRVAIIQPNRSARVWSAIDGRAVTTELSCGVKLVCIAFSPDGQSVVVGGVNGVAYVWDVSSGKQRLPPLEPPDVRREVNRAVYSPDGRKILTVNGDQWGRIWDAKSGALIAQFKHDGNLYLADWHPSGDRVITGGLSPGIRTWDARDGHSLLPPMNHPLGLHTLSYSADGKLIVSASFDHTVHVWDASTGESVIPPVKAGRPARDALLLNGGRRLFCVSEDGVGRFVRLIPTKLPTQSLRDYAAAVAGYDIDDLEAPRKLSKDQVVEYFQRFHAQHPEFFGQPQSFQE